MCLCLAITKGQKQLGNNQKLGFLMGHTKMHKNYIFNISPNPRPNARGQTEPHLV